MDIRNGRIAIVTDDGINVSSHFGRAPFYEVIELKDGKVSGRMRRNKAGHHTFSHEESGGGDHGEMPAVEKHTLMVSPILDCQFVIVRGIGQGAVTHLRDAGLTPVLTALNTIDQVVAAINTGTIDNDPRRIHMNHGMA